MKSKFILTLLLAAASLSATALTPSYGVRLSMDVTLPSGSENTYKNGAGFMVGGVAKIGLPKNFFVEPGLMFRYTGMNTKNLVTFDDKYYYEGAAKFYGLRIPVNIGRTFNVAPMMALDVTTGPYLDINLSAKQGYDPNPGTPLPEPAKDLDLFKKGWRRVDAGWGLGLSMTFAHNYYVGISGGVAVSPLAKYGNKDKLIRIRRNNVAITLGYNF